MIKKINIYESYFNDLEKLMDQEDSKEFEIKNAAAKVAKIDNDKEFKENLKKFYENIYTVEKFNKENYMMVVELDELIHMILISLRLLNLVNTDCYSYYKMVSKEISSYYKTMYRIFRRG